MNKTLIILSLVVLASCDAKVQVPSKNLVERDSIKYEVNSQTPFTGSYVSALCLSKGANYTEFCTINYKDGVLDGLSRSTDKNGIEYHFNFKDGELDGLSEVYHSNSILKSKVYFKDGKQEGLAE